MPNALAPKLPKYLLQRLTHANVSRSSSNVYRVQCSNLFHNSNSHLPTATSPAVGTSGTLSASDRHHTGPDGVRRPAKTFLLTSRVRVVKKRHRSETGQRPSGSRARKASGDRVFVWVPDGKPCGCRRACTEHFTDPKTHVWYRLASHCLRKR